MANYTKFGVREIANVVFKAAANGTKFCGNTYNAGQPILYFDSLKTSTVEGAGTTVYADGGRGNTHLVSWTGEKTITFTMEDALISPLSLAALASARVDNTNSNKTVHVTEFITPDSSSYTISGVVGDCYYALVDEDNNLTEVPVKASVSTGTATLSVVSGKTYYVDYYKTSTATVISLTGDDLGINFYVEAETLFRGQDGLDRPAEFIIPKAKIQSNFTFSMAATGDPSTFTFTMDAFPGKTKNNPNKKVLCEINVLNSIYDPEGGTGEHIGVSGSKSGDIATIRLDNVDSGLTYKYKTSTTSTVDSIDVGDDAPGSGYTAITFTDNVFAFEPTTDHKYIKVIAINSSDKVAAISDVYQFDTAE